MGDGGAKDTVLPSEQLKSKIELDQQLKAIGEAVKGRNSDLWNALTAPNTIPREVREEFAESTSFLESPVGEVNAAAAALVREAYKEYDVEGNLDQLTVVPSELREGLTQFFQASGDTFKDLFKIPDDEGDAFFLLKVWKALLASESSAPEPPAI